MKISKPIAQATFLLLGIILFAPGCAVTEPREGYYDRDQNRWYHEHAWQTCDEEHCHH
jgi:hypothetical protein